MNGTASRDQLLHEIAETFGTPTYVYDLAAIRRRVELLRSEVGEAELHYAVKANPNGAVLRELAGLGLGAEVITLGELERAVRAGFPAGRLLIGGPGQDHELMERASRLKAALVSLDSRSQWESWRDVRDSGTRFLIRINPQLDPDTHPHLATGAADSKFGMTEAEAVELAAELAREGVLAGFHFHIGSQIRSLAGYEQLADIVDRVFEARPEANVLDLGGGFAVPDFPLARFARLAHGVAGRHGAALLLEPGRYLVAEAGVLLTTVRHVKPGPLRHVIADAGMADLLRPALYGASHPVRRLANDTGDSAGDDTDGSSGGDSGDEAADLDGPLCENSDRLGQGARLPVNLERGDLLAVEQAGAYGMAMASNYASSLRPAEVVVDGDEFRLVRRRETIEDLLGTETA